MKNTSYFSPFSGSPLATWLNRKLHPYTREIRCSLNQHQLVIKLTQRADQALAELPHTLTIEMQLYFSCMVKKRVLFHTQAVSFETDQVTPQLNIAYRSVQSDTCSPEEFAAQYPQKQVLDNPVTKNRAPSELSVDYIDNKWEGDFLISKNGN